MATIALYANKINQMPELINNIKKSVTDYKTELSTLKTKSLSINKSVCNLDDVISSIQTSSQTQEQKIASLDAFSKNSEQFVSDADRIDSEVAEVINQRKDDFYDKYDYLKPDSEKSWLEKRWDDLKSVGEWCKEHWKLIVTVVLVVVAIVLICTGVGGPFAAIILGACKGLIMGAITGGLMGGISSLASGGSFWEGAENGAFTGALTGALFGGLGGAGQALGAAGKLGTTCKALSVLKYTSMISGGISMAMGGFDLLAFGVGLFDPSNPLVVLNQKLHSSTLYNTFQIGVSALAVFSGGAYQGLKSTNPVCFVAGTMIATVAGMVAIENIKAGNKVFSTNVETWENGEKSVLRTFVNESKELVHIFVNGEEITTTPRHLFYVVDKGWTVAENLIHGNILLMPDTSHVKIERVTFEIFEKPVEVYNFEVEDWHTYHVGNISILVHNDCEYTINANGDIEVTDWKDYPEGQPKPEGTLRLIDGDEYDAARKAANSANRNIHKADPSLKGIDIHEVQPVKWGGSPTDTANKIPLPRSQHNKLTGWWKTFQAAVEKNSR